MIVRLTGGLGNQLFMYAFGRSLSDYKGEELRFYWSRSSWDYGLDAYNTYVKLVNYPHNSPTYDEKTFAFDSDVYANPPNTFFRGYWQTEKYFYDPEGLRKEISLKVISPKLAEEADCLRNENSVFVHVRRGDYLNPGTAAFHGNGGHAGPNEGYYRDAMDYVRERVTNPQFYVFSDDPLWCLENFPTHHVVSGLGFNAHEELYLMSQCRHGIGANSTFSWWANWLGEHPSRICVAPKKWFNNDFDTKDLIPERWTRI
jgi:Glycosyl transferase family 11